MTQRGTDTDLQEYREVFTWVRPTWYKLGLCDKKYKVYTKTGMETIWFSTNRKDQSLAKQVCRQCPIRWACLSENLDAPAGVFGGTSPKQRKLLESMVVIRTKEVIQVIAESLGM